MRRCDRRDFVRMRAVAMEQHVFHPHPRARSNRSGRQHLHASDGTDELRPTDDVRNNPECSRRGRGDGFRKLDPHGSSLDELPTKTLEPSTPRPAGP